MKSGRFGLLAALLLMSGCSEPDVRTGSKNFIESEILGQMLGELARQTGRTVEHKGNLGTRVLFDALALGEIDAYVEYTGTITGEILADRKLATDEDIRSALAEYGILMSRPLGFNNTYILGIPESLARSRHIATVSDLADHADLIYGFSNEFMDRSDGWPGLKAAYGLNPARVTGMDHALAYQAIETGAIHVTDLYSTDAEIDALKLRALQDDRRYFPDYHAVILYRRELVDRQADVVKVFSRLQGAIDEPAMVKMNAGVKLGKIEPVAVAARYLEDKLSLTRASVARDTHARSWSAVASRIWKHTREHLFLVGISLSLAVVFAIPLGIVAAKVDGTGSQVILGTVGVIQTIPSLALLVFMIPLFKIGETPAVVALFLYSLLPIVRNTHTGLSDIPIPLRESAVALGLNAKARLRLIELPMASRAILAGIKTSAVINIGTATLGALIGAGGYGQPILTGIARKDTGLILQGAIPAAALALLVQGAFELADRLFVPRGLRLPRSH